MSSIILPIVRSLSNPTLLVKDDYSQSSMSLDLGISSKQDEADCIQEIKDFFRNFGVRLPEETVFRYACFHNFNAEEAIDAIREDNYNPYLQLKMKDLEEQFETDSIFPIPHLRTRKNNSDVVYMRPSRFNKKNKKTSSLSSSSREESCDKVIESLCYVLNDLSQTEEQCRNGVTVIADMQGITKDNFNKGECTKLIEALQGDLVPTRVGTFLIVSPPSWFGRIWKWMRPAMSKDFARRVHLIKQERLSEFLMGDYEMYLPDDFCLGLAHSSEIAEDYVDLKMLKEQ